jgi:hypothetical protein
MGEDPDVLARVVHEARRAFGAALDRPMTPVVWEERHPRQQALDREIASAVASAERRRIAGEIRDYASRRWPPGYHRDELFAAAAAVARGMEDPGEEKEAAP